MEVHLAAPYDETATGLEQAEAEAVDFDSANGYKLPLEVVDEVGITPEKAGDLIKRIDDTLNDLKALARSAEGEAQVNTEDVKVLGADDPEIKALLRSNYEILLDESGEQLSANQLAQINDFIRHHETVRELREAMFTHDHKPRSEKITPYNSRAYTLKTWRVFFELLRSQAPPKSLKLKSVSNL